MTLISCISKYINIYIDQFYSQKKNIFIKIMIFQFQEYKIDIKINYVKKNLNDHFLNFTFKLNKFKENTILYHNFKI